MLAELLLLLACCLICWVGHSPTRPSFLALGLQYQAYHPQTSRGSTCPILVLRELALATEQAAHVTPFVTVGADVIRCEKGTITLCGRTT